VTCVAPQVWAPAGATAHIGRLPADARLSDTHAHCLWPAVPPAAALLRAGDQTKKKHMSGDAKAAAARTADN